MINIESQTPTAELEAKQKELSGVLDNASIAEYSGKTYIRINGALIEYQQFFEAQISTMFDKIQIGVNQEIISVCAYCEARHDPKHAVVKWLTQNGIKVSHGACQKHYEEECKKYNLNPENL